MNAIQDSNGDQTSSCGETFPGYVSPVPKFSYSLGRSIIEKVKWAIMPFQPDKSPGLSRIIPAQQ